jgi:hypothetical protein
LVPSLFSPIRRVCRLDRGASSSPSLTDGR